MERYEWTLHITTDKGGNPEFCWVTVEDEHGQAYWVGDAEWGPFDSIIDVIRWVARTMGAHLVGARR